MRERSGRLMRRMRGTLLLPVLMGTMAAVACDGDPPGPPVPRSGTVDVMLTTPNADDRGVIITVGAAVTGFTPAGGFQVFENTAGGTTTLLLAAGSAFGPGEVRVGSFTLSDVSTAATTSLTVQEVATADFDVRTALSGYSLRLVPR